MEGSDFSWLLSICHISALGRGRGHADAALPLPKPYGNPKDNSWNCTIPTDCKIVLLSFITENHQYPKKIELSCFQNDFFLFSPNFGPESIFMRKWASPALAPWSWLWTYSFALHCGVVVVSCHGFICRAGEGRGERAVETFTYDIHLFWIFWPAPPCHVHKSADFASLVCFLVIPLPPPSTEVTCACPPRTLYGLVKMLNRGKWSCRICFAAVGRRTRFFRGSIPFQLWLDERPSSQLGAMCVIRG